MAFADLKCRCASPPCCFTLHKITVSLACGRLSTVMNMETSDNKDKGKDLNLDQSSQHATPYLVICGKHISLKDKVFF